MSTPRDGTGANRLPEDVAACLLRLERAVGEQLVGVIFFGSRLLQTSPDRHSAADLFVVVEDYVPFYNRLREAGLVRGRPGWLAILNRWLPPNVLSIDSGTGPAPACKCFVIARHPFARAMSTRARDHFCRGRLTQTVSLVHARDEAARDEIESRIRQAREDSLIWVPDLLPRHFTVDDYCLEMLQASFAAEIRPEDPGRVREVFESQREAMGQTYGRILQENGPARGIVGEEDGYVRGPRRAWPTRLRQRLWFAQSRVRATLRWTKHVQTYEGWLDYIVHKIHRRTGMRLELTDAERRWPFVLLWPKFFSVVNALVRQRSSKSSGGPDA